MLDSGSSISSDSDWPDIDPNKIRAGEIDERLISFVDFAPTLLSMVSISTPEYYQGQVFEGKYKSNKQRLI